MNQATPNELPQATIQEEFKRCVENDLQVKAGIIESLPDDTVEQLVSFLEEEKALHKKYHGGAELLEEHYERVIAGRLFEALNYQEYTAKVFRGLAPKSPEWKRAEDIMFVSSTLCKIARYPREYGLDIDEDARIPDGVYTGITKEGNFLVYGLAEAKLGAIDERALSQIKLSGSRTTMATIIEQLQEKISSNSAEEMNPEIAQLAEVLGDRKLEVKWDIDKKGVRTPRMSLEILIPTRGSDYFSSNVLLEKSSLQPEFDRVLSQQRVTSKTSCFSAQDVHSMTAVVMERI